MANLKGFYKSPKTVKKKRKRPMPNSGKSIRAAVIKHLGLNQYATNIGICLAIHCTTKWTMPTVAKNYPKFIRNFYNKCVKHGQHKAIWHKLDHEFYDSKQWRELRYAALSLSEGKCNLCGATAHDGAILHVDHIKPRSKHPELSLDLDNVSVLCADCNIGKSNYDDFDYRNKM